jgi:hypothetical protein
MVMFKAHFKPSSGKPSANAEPKAQQPQPTPPQQDRKAPPIEQERGPQYPIKEPGPGNPPERAR